MTRTRVTYPQNVHTRVMSMVKSGARRSKYVTAEKEEKTKHNAVMSQNSSPESGAYVFRDDPPTRRVSCLCENEKLAKNRGRNATRVHDCVHVASRVRLSSVRRQRSTVYDSIIITLKV